MFASALVREWRTDGGRRVHPRATSPDYILNTNRMFDLHETSHNITGGATKQAGMWFFDNSADYRDGGAYLRCERTVTALVLAADFGLTYQSITLDVFPDDDLTADTEELTIAKQAVSYAWAHDSGEGVYVVYSDGAWANKRVLIDHTMAGLYTELND